MNNNTDELLEIIFKVSRLLKGEMSFTNNLVHLSILQIQALFYLNQHKDQKISMSDIAGYFRIELSSATSLLNKLYALQLVERHTDENDRRLVLISLTNKGEILLEQAMSQRENKLKKVLLYLSEKEKLELLNIFNTLYKRLQKP